MMGSSSLQLDPSDRNEDRVRSQGVQANLWKHKRYFDSRRLLQNRPGAITNGPTKSYLQQQSTWRSQRCRRRDGCNPRSRRRDFDSTSRDWPVNTGSYPGLCELVRYNTSGVGYSVALDTFVRNALSHRRFWPICAIRVLVYFCGCFTHTAPIGLLLSAKYVGRLLEAFPAAKTLLP